ncbi:hypothetical protein PENDEC_c001G03078 [Penicillium decumbens]|uniref:Uncharacterized protein n=1 Tax=Penicillium decumbens TaxID=69771 RepID=A0A1V6PN52_PENDC|nr:hypothetical protein PENDEC_c001G03078 [Penicillium decumbens]
MASRKTETPPSLAAGGSTDSSSTESAEPPVKRTTEGIITVDRPCDTDNVTHHAPTSKYWGIIFEVNAIELSDKDRQLLKATNRLQGLHYAHRSCTVARLGLDKMNRETVLSLMCAWDHYLQSGDWPVFIPEDEGRTALDMCKFIFYNPYVKQDLEDMEEGPQKDVLMRLYHCICTHYTV